MVECYKWTKLKIESERFTQKRVSLYQLAQHLVSVDFYLAKASWDALVVHMKVLFWNSLEMTKAKIILVYQKFKLHIAASWILNNVCRLRVDWHLITCIYLFHVVDKYQYIRLEYIQHSSYLRNLVSFHECKYHAWTAPIENLRVQTQ
jgi:hypothetical protein